MTLGVAPIAGASVGGFRFVSIAARAQSAAAIGAVAVGGFSFAFTTSSGYTLTADPGSYTIAGAAVSLTVARLLRAYNDLIANGTFPTDISGWTVNGTDTVFAAAAGEGVLTLGPAAAGGYAYQAITVVPGKPYTLSGLLRSTKTYSMTITPGSYALVGTDVTLTKGNAATIHNQNLSRSGAGAIGIGYTIKNDGTVVQADSTEHFLETWLPSGSVASAYDVRATVTSGVTGSGSYGSWLNLNIDRNWSLTESSIGTLTTTILVELAHAGTGVAFTSATITLTATRTS